MAKRRNADLFEVLICQISKDGKIDVVLGKAVSVLPETEPLKPICNLLHGQPHGLLVALDHANSSNNVFASFRSRVSNPSVNRP